MSPGGQSLTVLLVEDNPGDVRLIRDAMRETRPDFRVETEATLAAGLARLRSGGLDVVLLDLGLPDPQVLDTVAAVHRESPATPVVLLTGLADEELGLRAVQAGAQDYLVKGRADGRLLVRAIRYAVERHGIEQALKAMVAELNRKTEDLEAFLYSASHDLKEPLRALGVFSQFLLEDYADRMDDTGTDYLHRLFDASVRMTRMVDDLLTLSRVGRPPEAMVPVDVAEVAREVLAELQPKVEEKHAWIVVEEDMPLVCADPVRIAQVLRNLLSNALKFTRTRNPEARLGAKEVRKGMVTLYLCDDGIGIDERHKEQIFGLFQRLHRREDYEGTGAGLAIARRAVEVCGGRIWVESTPGVGSTFYFTLPVAVETTLARAA